VHLHFCILKCTLQGIDQNKMTPGQNTRTYMHYSLLIACGFFPSQSFFFFAWTVKDCEKEPTVYSPYPRRLENLFPGITTKAALSPQLFLDPECWSDQIQTHNLLRTQRITQWCLIGYCDFKHRRLPINGLIANIYLP